MGGPSDTQVNLMHEQAQLVQNEIMQQSQQYAESQYLFNTLQPILLEQRANPTGFSAQELADLNASNVNTTGAQYANVQKQLNLRNSSENMAGLTSGVAAGETAALQSSAAGTVASNASRIQIENAQLAEQKRQSATSELLALQSGQGGMAIGIGNTENRAEQQAYEQANQVNQQQGITGSPFTDSLLGAGLGIGMDFLTGGLSGLGEGGSFLTGGLQGAGGGTVTG